MQKAERTLLRKRYFIIIIFLLLFSILGVTAYKHTHKPLPAGTSYEGDVYYTDDVRFLYDLTYKNKAGETEISQQIFKRVYSVIEEAEDFIVLDMFLFNPWHNKDLGFPKITHTLTEKLLEKKQQNKDFKIVFITDEVNLTYGSHSHKYLDKLKDAGVEVVFTKLNPLRDSNPLYTSIWRTFFQWFGQEGYTWLPNPMADTAPKVTLRSYLQILNIKANHRKVLVTDKTAIVLSANPHDASGFHSNIAFEVSGSDGLLADLLETEQAASRFSGGGELPKVKRPQNSSGEVAVQVLTEGKIYKHILEELKQTEKNEQIWLGMFYLADRKVMDELKAAAKRGVKVRIIMDPNQNAFGTRKMGLPNIPTSAELMKLGSGNIEIRWYNTGSEQYHSKLMYIKKASTGSLIGGSANFTRRNLDDFNLETNLKIKSDLDTQVMQDVDSYFNKLWHNEDGNYTVSYDKNKDRLTPLKYAGYWLQKVLRFTTY